MDFDKVLADIHEQLRNLDMAIESLERLGDGDGNGGRRRSRPPNGSPPRKATRKTSGDAVADKKHG